MSKYEVAKEFARQTGAVISPDPDTAPPLYLQRAVASLGFPRMDTRGPYYDLIRSVERKLAEEANEKHNHNTR